MKKRNFYKSIKFLMPLCFVLLQYALFYFFAKLVCMPYGPFNFETSFDRNIPFVPGFIYIYIGAFFFWLASFMLIASKDIKAFYSLTACVGITFFVSFLIFVFMPTTIVRPVIEGGGFTNQIVKFIYFSDTPPINLFPSMHCLSSWLCYIYVRSVKNVSKPIKILFFFIALAVFVSTQFVKQHYIADVFGGVLIAELGALFVRKMNLGTTAHRCFIYLNKKLLKIHIKYGKKIRMHNEKIS